MKIRSDKQRIRDVLTQTIVSLCHTGLNFNKQMTVEGLLGITLDNNDVFLVNIKEVLQPAFGSTEDSPGSPASEKSGRDRDQRRSVQRGSKRKVVCVDEDEDSRGSDLMLMEEQSPASTHPQEDMRVPPATYHHDSPHSSRTTFAHQPDFTSYSASSRSIGPNHQSKSDTRDSFSISDSHDDTVVKEESGLLSSCQISSISRPPSSAESGRSEQTDIAEHSHHGSHSVLPSGSEVTSADDDLKIKAEPDYLDTDYGALQPMEDTGGLPDFSSITADESGLTAAEVGFDPSLLAHAQAGPSHMSMPGPMPSTSDASGTQVRELFIFLCDTAYPEFHDNQVRSAIGQTVFSPKRLSSSVPRHFRFLRDAKNPLIPNFF